MATTVRTISSNARSQDYDILIEPGVLDNIRDHLPAAHKYVIIADSNVAAIYARTLQQQIPGATVITFHAGEKYKTAATWQTLTDQMIDAGAGRDTCVLALGGGVTGDLAGFVAATYMRGIPVVQVPTTLLAMIDASIGGKTGIDIASGKNLVGAFHQPSVVVIDPRVLKTLPNNELRYGLAEAIKHGAIADAEYMEWIGENIGRIESLEEQTISHLITRSVEIKARFVAADVLEAGARAALNFGHTIGHALEQVTNYAIPHGEAVACGMAVELTAAEAAGHSDAGSSKRLSVVLEAAKLPAALPKNTEAGAVLMAARTDKKTRQGDVRYAVPPRIGEFSAGEDGKWTRVLPDDVVIDVLRRLSIT